MCSMAIFPMTLGDPSPPNHPNFGIFCCPSYLHSKTSCLVYRLTVASPSLWTTKLPWKGRGYVMWPVFTARRYAKRGICRHRVSVCLCVCVSVTLRYCIKTAERRITQITPHGSPGTLVFWHQSSRRNSNGITPYGGDNCRWGGLKFVTFDEKRAITRKPYKIEA